MSLVNAAIGAKMFFDQLIDYGLVFVSQYWIISFDYQWYRIEYGDEGVQYFDGTPYWVDAAFRDRLSRLNG